MAGIRPPIRVRLWWKFLCFGAASPLFVAFVLPMFLLAMSPEHLLYFPRDSIRHTPSQVGLEYQTVHLKTKDQQDLLAWYVPAQSARGTVLYCHGTLGNIGDRIETLANIHRLGLNVLIFDYRGYGESTGSPSEQGTYADADAAWQYLREEKGFEEHEILIWGRSLGGAVAIWLASQHQPAGLIAESTFTSYTELGEQLLPWLPFRRWGEIKYPSAERVSQLRIPLLYAHSPDDMLINYTHGQRLFRNTPSSRDIVNLEGNHNDDSLSHPRHHANLEAYLQSIFPAAR